MHIPKVHVNSEKEAIVLGMGDRMGRVPLILIMIMPILGFHVDLIKQTQNWNTNS